MTNKFETVKGAIAQQMSHIIAEKNYFIKWHMDSAKENLKYGERAYESFAKKHNNAWASEDWDLCSKYEKKMQEANEYIDEANAEIEHYEMTIRAYDSAIEKLRNLINELEDIDAGRIC